MQAILSKSIKTRSKRQKQVLMDWGVNIFRVRLSFKFHTVIYFSRHEYTGALMAKKGNKHCYFFSNLFSNEESSSILEVTDFLTVIPWMTPCSSLFKTQNNCMRIINLTAWII